MENPFVILLKPQLRERKRGNSYKNRLSVWNFRAEYCFIFLSTSRRMKYDGKCCNLQNNHLINLTWVEKYLECFLFFFRLKFMKLFFLPVTWCHKINGKFIHSLYHFPSSALVFPLFVGRVAKNLWAKNVYDPELIKSTFCGLTLNHLMSITSAGWQNILFYEF